MGIIYWTNLQDDSINRSTFEGSGTRILASNLGRPLDIVPDVFNNKIYWTDFTRKQITSANPDGTGSGVILSASDFGGGGEGPEGGGGNFRPVSIDFHPSGSTSGTNGQIFFTEHASGAVDTKEIGVDGVTALYEGLIEPNGIYVHSGGNLVYFTDAASGIAGSGAIFSINRDGTNLTTILSGGNYSPHGISVHESSGYIFWCDQGEEAILRSNLSGGDVTTIVSNVSGARDIGIDETQGKIFWSDTATDKAFSANLNGTDKVQILGSMPVGVGLDVSGILSIIDSNSLNLFLKVSETPPISNSLYIEKINTFSSSGLNDWFEADLSSFGVPGNVVAEIAIGNNFLVDSRMGGVRQVGSSIDRRIDIDHAVLSAGDGRDYCIMHVNVSSGSKIETYAETTNINFTLLGYWTSGAVYVEAFEQFSSIFNNEWGPYPLADFTLLDINNEKHIISEGQVAEILMTNGDATFQTTIGVRTQNSNNERKILLDDTDNSSARDCSTMFVKAGGTNTNQFNAGDSTIEIFTDDTADGEFNLIGYWAVAPQEYNEFFLEIPKPSGNNTWEFKELPRVSGFNLIGSGIGEVLLATKSAIQESNVGIRESGSSLQRIFDFPRTGSNSFDVGRAHVNINNGATLVSGHGVEVLNENATADGDFVHYLLGFWGQTPPTGSIDLFIFGGDPRAGKVYWIETSGSVDMIGTIRKSNLDGTEIETLVTGLEDPQGLALAPSIEKIYWAELTEIKRSDLDGSNVETMYDPATGLFGELAFNSDDSKLYFSLDIPDRIQAIGLEIPNGETAQTRSDVENIILTTISNVDGIGFDLQNDQIVFSDPGNQEIEKADYDGGSRSTIVDNTSGLNSPRGVDVLEASGQVYWCEVTTDPEGLIQRSNLDGSNVETIITGLSTPQRIKIDDQASKIYWCDEGSKNIQRSNAGGSFIETVYTSDNNIPLIDLDLVGRSNGSLDLFLKVPEPKENDIDLFLKVPEPSNNNLDLFLEADTATTGSITCYIQGPIPSSGGLDLVIRQPEFNSFNLRINGKDLPTQPQIFITALDTDEINRDKIFRLDIVPGASGGHTLQEIVISSGTTSPLPMGGNPVLGFDGINEVALDTEEGRVYWADDLSGGESGSIRRANLDGFYAEDFIAGVQSVAHGSGYTVNEPKGLSIDELNRKIYWTDVSLGTARILKADLTGENVEVLLDGFSPIHVADPKSLVLDTINEKIYWINGSAAAGATGAHIRRANLDGSSQEVVIEISNTANSLAINAAESKLYWNLPTLGIIKRADTDGTNEINFVEDEDTPQGLLVDIREDKLYWVEHDLGTVKRANIDFLSGEDAGSRTDIETVATFNPVSPVAMDIQYPALTVTATSGQLDLFINGPAPTSGAVELFIANSGIFDTWTLFLDAEDIVEISDDISLYITASESGTVFTQIANDVNLFLKAAGDPSESPVNLNTTLYLEVASGDLETNKSWTLFLDADTTTTSSLNLFLGAQVKDENSISFFIFSDKFVNNWSMFLQGKPGTENDISLFVSGVPREPVLASGEMTLYTSGIFIPEKDLKLYIFGVSGVENNNITLFINPAPIQINEDFKLYTHGF